jgi:hypothetical protein
VAYDFGLLLSLRKQSAHIGNTDVTYTSLKQSHRFLERGADCNQVTPSKI